MVDREELQPNTEEGAVPGLAPYLCVTDRIEGRLSKAQRYDVRGDVTDTELNVTDVSVIECDVVFIHCSVTYIACDVIGIDVRVVIV